MIFIEKGDEFMVERNVPERAKLDEIVDLGDNDDMLYFHLNTSTDQITIGLSSILQCLKFAESEEYIPELPLPWWINLYGIYPRLAKLIDIPEEEDEKI